MTSEGWKAVEDMTRNTKIGLLIEPKEMSYEVKQVMCILTEEKFREYFVCRIYLKLCIDYLVEKLKSIQLIPLFNDNEKLSILARIIGYVITDRWLNICSVKGRNNRCYFANSVLTLGTKLDAEIFEKDVEKL